MPKTIKNKDGKPTYVISGGKTPRGQEVWRVASDGKVRTSVTSATSASVMDRAVRIYGGALERLAKR